MTASTRPPRWQTSCSAKRFAWITFTGPGGVGKSRLAIEAAARLRPAFADGVRFVDLGSVSDPGLVPAAIAVRLGLRTSGGRLVADLMSYLRGKHLLLLLDNFEQVVGAAPLIAQLLAAAADLAILVTSRTVLRLTGEYELCVPPLATPPAGQVRQTRELLEYASVRLFVARARAAAPGFELTSRNAQAIAGICRALDGLPLAIELAVAWIRLLTPQALLARLDDRLSVLTAGPRDLPERQRTLRSTLDWSFGLLSASQQALFARLGVFAGTFGLPAVAAICGDAVSAEPPVLTRVTDTLASLVDSSLVRAEPHDDEPRFSLLETVRAYALDRLRESGHWEGVHDRHASYFAGLVKPAESELRGAEQLQWLNRLEMRHDNVGAALSWLLERDEPGPALDVVRATWKFWWLRGHAEELVHYADKILARSDSMAPHQRAHALSAAGFAHFTDSDQTRSRRLLKQSLSLYRQVNDKLCMGLTAAALGHLLATQRQSSQVASDLLERTLIELGKLSDDRLPGPDRIQYLLDVALAANFLGQIKLDQGDRRRAAELFTDGLSAAESAADRFTILISLYDLALGRQAAGNLDDAADLLRQGISMAAEARDEPSLANYLEALAAVAAQQDRPERATSLLAAASALLEASGSGWLRAYVPHAPPDDRMRAALHARMTETAFGRAWSKGRALTGTGAVRYALEDASRDRQRLPWASADRRELRSA